MKELVVLSGKGGTGKTSIVGSFAALSGGKVLADCDVDAADLHLLLSPAILREEEFWSGQVAAIDIDRCSRCGLCEELCRFGAITDLKVEPMSCEGCGFCSRICPDQAITMSDCLSGHWFVSQTRYGPLIHARLGVAAENSGRLVAVVRQRARSAAENENLGIIVTDGPPGIGCPVISSLSGADLALVVTEPTLSGIHDLERVLGVCHHFGVPAIVCVNKYDINEENTRKIERFCSNHGIQVVSKIALDNVFTEALVKGLPVVEYTEGRASREVDALWRNVLNRLQM